VEWGKADVKPGVKWGDMGCEWGGMGWNGGWGGLVGWRTEGRKNTGIVRHRRAGITSSPTSPWSEKTGNKAWRLLLCPQECAECC